jgi:hypothetical protein
MMHDCINIFAKERSWSDWGSNPRPTATLPITKILPKQWVILGQELTETLENREFGHNNRSATFSVSLLNSDNFSIYRVVFEI